MFTNIFGSTTTTIEEDVKQNLFRNTLSSNTFSVKNTIIKHNVNISSNNMVDECGQNLLHIAVRTKNYDLVRYFMSYDIDKNKKNMFGESPVDIAMKNNDQKMLEIFFVREPDMRHKNENVRLSNRVGELEINNKKLIETNKDLTIKNGILHMQRDEAVTFRKRKADEYDICIVENKKLKTENIQLKSDNSALQNTVMTLRSSMKK